MSQTTNETQAWPGMRTVAKMIGVSASTLSRRSDLDWVTAGQWMRLRPRQVMILAKEYKKRNLNEVAEDLVNYADYHAHPHLGAVRREVDTYLQEISDQSAAMSALAMKIRERAKLRQEDPGLAAVMAPETSAQGVFPGKPRRMKAVDEFLRAYRSWQNQGYSFGEMCRTIDNFNYYKSPWGGRWSGQATLKMGMYGSPADREYILIEISESANPWDEKGHERLGAPNQPPTGVLVFGSVQVLKPGAYPSEKIYKPAQMYIHWFAQDKLDQVKLSLIPMLEELVDVINPPALEESLPGPGLATASEFALGDSTSL